MLIYSIYLIAHFYTYHSAPEVHPIHSDHHELLVKRGLGCGVVPAHFQRQDILNGSRNGIPHHSAILMLFVRLHNPPLLPVVLCTRASGSGQKDGWMDADRILDVPIGTPNLIPPRPGQ